MLRRSGWYSLPAMLPGGHNTAASSVCHRNPSGPPAFFDAEEQHRSSSPAAILDNDEVNRGIASSASPELSAASLVSCSDGSKAGGGFGWELTNGVPADYDWVDIVKSNANDGSERGGSDGLAFTVERRDEAGSDVDV